MSDVEFPDDGDWWGDETDDPDDAENDAPISDVIYQLNAEEEAIFGEGGGFDIQSRIKTRDQLTPDEVLGLRGVQFPELVDVLNYLIPIGVLSYTTFVYDEIVDSWFVSIGTSP